MSVAEFFKKARENANMTQKEISDKLGYSTPQFISNVERGICLFPMAKVKEFVKVTKCSAKDLKKTYVDAYNKEISRFF